MNLDILFAIIFYLIIFLYYLTHKDKFEVQGKIFVLYKTNLGIKLMDRIANFSPRFLKFLSYLSILTGFVGMILIFVFLIIETFKMLTIPGTPPAIAPVLPGVAIPGLPVLSFWHWIISILIVATIHEFSHGIFARLNKIPINSSGFAFLGPILAAFVEPDEKILEKKSKKQQLAVFSAGPFSNVLTGLIFLIIALLIVSPFAYSLIEQKGVKIISIEANSPAELVGLQPGEEILEINNIQINNISDFKETTSGFEPGQEISMRTSNNTYSILLGQNPKDSSKAYIGILTNFISSEVKQEALDKYGSFLTSFFIWFARLIEWLFLISLGIGLANLLPLGPVDGGRILLTSLLAITKNENKAKKIWPFISFFTIALIVINLWPYIQKLLVFIFSPLLALL